MLTEKIIYLQSPTMYSEELGDRWETYQQKYRRIRRRPFRGHHQNTGRLNFSVVLRHRCITTLALSASWQENPASQGLKHVSDEVQSLSEGGCFPILIFEISIVTVSLHVHAIPPFPAFLISQLSLLQLLNGEGRKPLRRGNHRETVAVYR